jgi:hypothetical protein
VLSREYNVTLVFAVLIVNHDHHTAFADGLYRFHDARDAFFHGP